MNTGLTQRDLDTLAQAAAQFPAIEQVLIFGSRAKGSHKKGSDVDLALKGRAVTDTVVNALSALLNEQLPLPYFFDVVHYDGLASPALVEHIDRVGQVIYGREKSSSNAGP